MTYTKFYEDWQDWPSKATLVSAAALEHIEAGIAAAGVSFNVTDPAHAGGADPTGAVDSTAQIQAAVNAAIAVGGTVVFPPSATFKVSDTINIVPAGGGVQAYMNIVANRAFQTQPTITWAGANNKPVFSSLGWRFSTVENIGIKIPATAIGVEAWRIDTDATRTSTTVMDFRNCSVYMDSGATNCFGWRLGPSGLLGDISAISWHDCGVHGSVAANNNTGWSIEQANAIGFHWYGGLSAFLNPMVKMLAGEGFSVFGMDGSHNDTDFIIGNPAVTFTMLGGRYEIGKRFMFVSHNTNQPQNIYIAGTKIYNYAPSDNILFMVQGVPTLTLDELQVVNRNGSDYTGQAVFLFCSGAGIGTLRVRGGVWQAAYPFFNAGGGGTATYRVECQSVTVPTNLGVYSNIVGRDQFWSLTYGTTVATDANLADIYRLVVTNGTAFTISNPTNAFPGRRITYSILNSSGGAMGAITWGAAFKLAGAFTNPANTKTRTISFYCDGTNWIETGRAAADI